MFRISCLSGLSGHVYRKVVEVARATGILGLIGFSHLRVALLIPLIQGFKPTQLKQLGETSILGFKNKSLQTFEPYPAFLRHFSNETRKRSLKDNDQKMAGNRGETDLVKVDFEVFGRVQGVFFRKYTQDQGSSLGLRGFCRNTSSGTVNGTMEGPRGQIEQMKQWLRKTGSPMSKIEKAEFRNEQPINAYSFKERFGVERTM